MREKLIKWVAHEELMNVKEASRLLGIKYQTAKSIMRRYMKTGKINRCNKILKPSIIHVPHIPDIALPKPKPKLAPNMTLEAKLEYVDLLLSAERKSEQQALA